jgi:hypothetical protein
MKNSKYIPWATILKEFNQNYSLINGTIFICNLSETFKKFWNDTKSKEKIHKLANQFLKEERIEEVVGEFENSDNHLLFRFRKVSRIDWENMSSFKNQTRIDFLNWAAKQNRKKKLRKI